MMWLGIVLVFAAVARIDEAANPGTRAACALDILEANLDPPREDLS